MKICNCGVGVGVRVGEDFKAVPETWDGEAPRSQCR